MAAKHYKQRSSATTMLRKLGIEKQDYNLFIEKTKDGVEVDMTLVDNYLNKPNASKPKTKAKAKAKSYSVSSLARKLILDGFTNPEVFHKLQNHFGKDRINDDHKHYPSWYRCELRRKGLLPEHLSYKAWEEPPRLEDPDEEA